MSNEHDPQTDSGDLTDKQRLFVEEYLMCWNGTQAAQRAGYSKRTARQMGTQNLAHPAIRAAIEARLDERAMSANETLARLALIARGDIADAIGFSGSGSPALDLAVAQKAGMTHLIQQIKVGRDGTSIKMYSALDALKTLVRVHGLERSASNDEDAGADDGGGDISANGSGSPLLPTVTDEQLQIEAVLAAG